MRRDAAELKYKGRYPTCSLSAPELPLSRIGSGVGKRQGLSDQSGSTRPLLIFTF